MSNIVRNEIFIRQYIRNDSYSFRGFGESMEVGRDVTITPKWDGSCFYCTLENNRNKKLSYNYVLELSYRSLYSTNPEPVDILSRSVKGLELKSQQSCNLGCSSIGLGYLNFCDNKPLEFIFRFEFDEILIPQEESLDFSGFTWLKDLRSLHEDNNFKDVTFKITNEELKAHSMILATRSKVFRLMLQHNTKERKEGVIEIKDCSVDSFKAFLKYCYTFEIDDIESRAADLLILADKYDVECLKKKCEEYLCEATQKSNVIAHLIAAYQGNSNLLKATVLIKFKSCVKELLQSKDSLLLNNYPLLFKEVMLLLDVEIQK